MSANSGSIRGGTPITITGSGFAQGDRVVIGQGHGAGTGAIAATGVSVVCSTQITATTWLGEPAPGRGTYSCIAPDRSASHAVSGHGFTYTAGAPAFAAVEYGCSGAQWSGDAGPYVDDLERVAVRVADE